MTSKPRISALINTLNEEHNVVHALRSVRPWVDQIVVVDMHSHDRTREIARDHGAEIYLHEPVEFADPARKFGLGKCTGDWVFVLDADELCPPGLSEVLGRIALEDQVDVVSVPRVNYLLGASLKYTGWSADRDRHERFFRRGKVELGPRIHRVFERSEGARVLSLPFEEGKALLHFNYTDLTQFIEKLNRYTSIEASQAFERGERHGLLGSVFAAQREFLRRYFVLQGYRDGWRGLYLSAMMAFYRLATHAKLEERWINGTRERVQRRYADEADRALAGCDAPPKRPGSRASSAA